MFKPLPSQDFLLTVLDYCTTTGMLSWRVRGVNLFNGNARRCDTWNARYGGTPALNYVNRDGYKTGHFHRHGVIKAHRVIWKLIHGMEPEYIDHINGIRSDNRIANLRSVTRDDNARNIGISRNNTSGANGVYWYPRHGKWMVSIRVNGRRKTVGYFADKGAAIAARRVADDIAGYSTWRDR